MAARPLPSHTYLRNILDYQPETGVLTRLHHPDRIPLWNARYAGKPAFTTLRKDGYLHGHIDGILFLAHRVIWKWMTGEEPPQIDHYNGKPADNRFVNLRASRYAENNKNRRMLSNNTSGVSGVSWSKDRQLWHAQICIAGKATSLGCFSTIEAAAAVRLAASREHGFSDRHGT